MADLESQIKCVAREIAMRKRVYPKWVATNRMAKDEADREIATMQSVLDMLIEMRPKDAG